MLVHRLPCNRLVALCLLILVVRIGGASEAKRELDEFENPKKLNSRTNSDQENSDSQNSIEGIALDSDETEDEDQEEKPTSRTIEAQKALEKLKSEIIKRVEQELEGMKGVCREDLRVMLGISPSSAKIQRPFRSTKSELSYCRRNQYSCCTSQEIKEATSLFARNFKKLKRSFEVIEELLVLFEGEKYQNIFADIPLDVDDVWEQCGKLNVLHLVNGREYRVTDPEFIKEQVEEINSLLVESQFFLKRQGWFYGNFICIACNPKEIGNFKNQLESVIIRARMKTCMEILDMFEFEKRLLKVYLLFLKPLADLYTCTSNVRRIPLHQQQPLPVLDPEIVWTMEGRFDSCYYKPTNKNLICQEICAKNPLKFEMDNKVRVFYARALEFYFPLLVQTSIRRFYRKVKKEEFNPEAPLSVEFFSSSAFGKRRVALSFGDDGVSVFSNELSKKHESFSD